MADNSMDLSKINFNNIGNWPIIIKVIAIAILCAAALGAGYYYDTMKQMKKLESLKKDEISLRKDFEKKQKKANVLEKLKEQLAEIKKSFGELLKRLPSKTEVEGLLVDISQTGLASGLSFTDFKPGNETPREFYRELPIQLTLVGTYHDLGKFVSGIAALPRIVTQHNITLRPQGQGTLILTETAKTYRYMDEEGK